MEINYIELSDGTTEFGSLLQLAQKYFPKYVMISERSTYYPNKELLRKLFLTNKNIILQ
jgi:hypothetical protein